MVITFGDAKEYAKLDTVRQELVDELQALLYEVQYAPLGLKAQKRREVSMKILSIVELAYKVHRLAGGTYSNKGYRQQHLSV